MTVTISIEEYEKFVRDSEVLEVVKRLHKNLGKYDFQDAADALFGVVSSLGSEDKNYAE